MVSVSLCKHGCQAVYSARLFVITITTVRFTFDPAKDAINREKHDVKLDTARALSWKRALIWPDTRADYGEPRQRALVPLGDRLYFVAFVDRDQERRIISLRKANNRELQLYHAYKN